MDRSPESLEEQQPLERFKPTTGGFVGWSGLALALGTVLYAVVNEHSLFGVRLGLAGLFGAVVVWVTQLRPRVTAYRRTLLMRGCLRDTWVPYVLVDDIVMAQTLNVYVGRKRYVCVGIGKSIGYDMRQRVRSQSGNTLFGSRAYQFTGRPEVGGAERKSSYQTFVLDRITDLVAASKARGQQEGEQPRVRQRYAVPELVGLVVSGLAFLLSLVL
jgi:hypothetical protein